MAKRRPKGMPRHSNRELALMIGGALLVAFVLAVTGAFFAFKPKPVDVDSATGCPQTGPSAVTAILIDMTDRVAAVTVADIRRRLADIVVETPTHGRIDLYAVESRGSEIPVRLVSVCSPGDFRDADPLVLAPGLIKKWWQERFSNPIDIAMREILTLPEAPASPIFENIGGVAVQSLSQVAVQNKPRMLVIISDLLQHSETFSLYRSPPDYTVFATDGVSRALGADLSGVDVRILLIQRQVKGRLNDGPYLDFWIKWLDDQRSGRINISKLTGSN